MLTTRRQFLKGALAGSIPLAVPPVLHGVGPTAEAGEKTLPGILDQHTGLPPPTRLCYTPNLACQEYPAR